MAGWQYFDAVSELQKQITAVARKTDSTSIGVLYPLLDSVEESVESLRLLVKQQALRDAYVIARVVYETAVNACFVLTDTVELSERAIVHSKQKTLRSLMRRIELAGTPLFKFEADGAATIMGQPKHQEWLRRYTSKSGREITAWTPETVQERLEAIYLRFGPGITKGLAFGLLLYRHASEIAHGTLYGTLFSWGATDIHRPLKSPSGLGIFRRAELRHVLKLVSFSIESLTCITSTVLGTHDLAAAAKRARHDYYEKRHGSFHRDNRKSSEGDCD